LRVRGSGSRGQGSGSRGQGSGSRGQGLRSRGQGSGFSGRPFWAGRVSLGNKPQFLRVGASPGKRPGNRRRRSATRGRRPGGRASAHGHWPIECPGRVIPVGRCVHPYPKITRGTSMRLRPLSNPAMVRYHHACPDGPRAAPLDKPAVPPVAPFSVVVQTSRLLARTLNVTGSMSWQDEWQRGKRLGPETGQRTTHLVKPKKDPACVAVSKLLKQDKAKSEQARRRMRQEVVNPGIVAHAVGACREESLWSQVQTALLDDYERTSSKTSRNYPRKKKRERTGPPRITKATRQQINAAKQLERQQQGIWLPA
jgi:hypothetical protein